MVMQVMTARSGRRVGLLLRDVCNQSAHSITPDHRPFLNPRPAASGHHRGDAAMAHVYEGQPDGRQSDQNIPVSRFRPQYRALTDDEKSLHDAIKAKAVELETLFEQVKPGRYRALGLTALEESVMWTVKELTS
ncbi:MAG: hypothetical protein VR70_14505 [Rhodospirillaceae bacterium BRH_c57]|nr:MAG: hypothetical protein VR70_14505 [Rhodospirillaceae bacterium BRH_c57]